VTRRCSWGSDASSDVTGTTFLFDGGLTAAYVTQE